MAFCGSAGLTAYGTGAGIPGLSRKVVDRADSNRPISETVRRDRQARETRAPSRGGPEEPSDCCRPQVGLPRHCRQRRRPTYFKASASMTLATPMRIGVAGLTLVAAVLASCGPAKQVRQPADSLTVENDAPGPTTPKLRIVADSPIVMMGGGDDPAMDLTGLSDAARLGQDKLVIVTESTDPSVRVYSFDGRLLHRYRS